MAQRRASSESVSHDLNSSHLHLEATAPKEPRRLSISTILSGAVPRRSTSSLPAEQDISLTNDNLLPPISKKKRKPKKVRTRNSQARDHGDFLASINGSGSIPKLAYQNPLLEAIDNGDLQRVRELITAGTIAGNSLKGALQNAAIKGHEEILKLLVESGKFDINDRDDRERTAVYAASSRGNDSILEFLLSHGAKPLSREEVTIAAMELRRWRMYETVFHNQRTLDDQDEGESINLDGDDDQGFESRGLYLSTNDDHVHKLEAASVGNIQEMIQKANEQRLMAQRLGQWVKSPTASPLPSRPASRGENPPRHKYPRHPSMGFEISVAEFNFRENGGHRFLSPSPTVDQLLYKIRNPLKLRDYSGSPSRLHARWYHVPANNLGWIEDLIDRIYEDRSETEQMKRDMLLTREPFGNGLQKSLDTSPKSRSLQPQYHNLMLHRDDGKVGSLSYRIALPYLHFESEDSRSQMTHVMNAVREAKTVDSQASLAEIMPDLKAIQARPEWSKNEKLLCACLYHEPPLHPRRTLDQFYYHMVEDTEQRDLEQVMPRYYSKIWRRNQHLEDQEEYDFVYPASMENKRRFTIWPRTGSGEVMQMQPSGMIEPKHLLMVDQLELWVLDDNTIISSFPQSWEHQDLQSPDSWDVLGSIHKYLTLVDRAPIHSIHDLADLIVYKCLATFTRGSTPYGPMKVLDVYESAIAAVTDMETKMFRNFAVRWKAKRMTSISTTLPDHPGELYNIDEEIEQLKEIKDIQDELHIMSVLLENQASVLRQATKMSAPTDISSLKDGDAITTSVSATSLERTLSMARQVNIALNHLLDLKQKQANFSAAQSARWTVEMTKAAQQKGNVMVVFTLVTIIFAPLSLVVTIF
ncbi:hypothetical protein BKA65DRAFT_533237 [Rhexocercosporidium sp. MPI-PUGE-AT-0058]|nr:hypothetical protein BKA65DRAFT_533237 [Rhexocercosporidium sp. MPI-PUGE-AT-0058]